MTRFHTQAANGISIAAGIVSLAAGVITLLTAFHIAVPNSGRGTTPPEIPAIVLSSQRRDDPDHGDRIRFLAWPPVTGPAELRVPAIR